MSLTPGARLGPYEVTALIGSGGMGSVYKAHDPKLQRTVAIKVLATQDEEASTRLLQEARSASALDHPNICTVYEVGEHEGQSFIAMAYVEGKPLSQLIPSDGLPPESVIRYGTQIADALAHAHERGIVHRDLKSANVVITPEGRAKVLDFGLATRLPRSDAEAVTKTQEALPHAGMLVGTLAYMAPEVLRGEAATARSDIWALGVLLYGMASGRLPFGGRTGMDLATAIVRDPPTSLTGQVSAGFRALVQHCLTKEPRQRYASAGEVRAALEAIQSDTSITQAAGIERAAGAGEGRRGRRLVGNPGDRTVDRRWPLRNPAASRRERPHAARAASCQRWAGNRATWRGAISEPVTRREVGCLLGSGIGEPGYLSAKRDRANSDQPHGELPGRR